MLSFFIWQTYFVVKMDTAYKITTELSIFCSFY
jgi:hypothetical protein